MTPLDIESTFAAVGLDAILRGKPRLGKRQLQEAADMPATIKRSLLRFLASDSWEPAADLPKLDYRKTLATVSAKKLNPAQVAALNAAVPDPDLAMDLGIKADAILAWAAGTIPREDPDPLTGQPTDDPPRGALLDFRRLWHVVNKPLSVLDDLADGSLFDDQVITLQQHFPELYKEILVIESEVIATMVARRGASWSPGPTKAALLQTLKGQSDIDMELAGMVQQAYAIEAAQQGAPPKPKTGPSAKLTESTPGQQQAAASPT